MSHIFFIVLSLGLAFSCKPRNQQEGRLLASQKGADEQKDTDLQNSFLSDHSLPHYLSSNCLQLKDAFPRYIANLNQELKTNYESRKETFLQILNIDRENLNEEQSQRLEDRAKKLWNFHYKLVAASDSSLPFQRKSRYDNTNALKNIKVLLRVYEGGRFQPVAYIIENSKIEQDRTGKVRYSIKLANQNQASLGSIAFDGNLLDIQFESQKCRISSNNRIVATVTRYTSLDNLGNKTFKYTFRIGAENSNSNNFWIYSDKFIGEAVNYLSSKYFEDNETQRSILTQ